jgi:hypothetical protein
MQLREEEEAPLCQISIHNTTHSTLSRGQRRSFGNLIQLSVFKKKNFQRFLDEVEAPLWHLI